jgi:hypothetical protein
MATYEEMFGDEDPSGPGAHLSGGFRFPSKPRPEPVASTAQIAVTPGMMLDVLRPSADAAPLRKIEPRPVVAGSYQEDLIEKAASTLRRLRIAGKARVPYDPDHPEPFWEACADTAKAALEVENSIADPDEAAIASAIFKAAGFYDGGIKLLTLRAQVEVQMFVMENARNVKFLFSKQQELIGTP